MEANSQLSTGKFKEEKNSIKCCLKSPGYYIAI